MLEIVTTIVWAVLGNWLLATCGVLLLLYIVGTWNFDFFARRGIPSTKPKWPFGGDFLATFKGTTYPVVLQGLYDKGRGHGLFGVFEFNRPILMVRDPELLKVIAVKEFDSFVNHRHFASEKNDPIFGKNLFNLKDHAWKEMRSTLSPTFTTSKIKTMMPLISECAKQFTATLREKYLNSEEGTMKRPLVSDMKDIFTRMTSDMTIRATFGVTTDSLKNPDNEFYTTSQTMANLNPLIFFIYLVLPNFTEKLGFRLLDTKTTNFFHGLVHGIVKERDNRGIFRPDILQTLMQARQGQQKVVKEGATESEGDKVTLNKLTDEDITSLSAMFFPGGVDAVSNAICFAAILLSHHQDVQKRLQAEIDEVMEETGGKSTYEAVQKMKYLDAVISEVLRIHPPAVNTERVCQKDTTLPAGAMSQVAHIPKGTLVNFPIICLHNDPEFWPEPEKFDPERFSDENKHKITPYTYIPFGLGPRICIGQRFALIKIKVVLVHFLHVFDLHPSTKTTYPVEYAPKISLVPKDGSWCGLTPRTV